MSAVKRSAALTPPATDGTRGARVSALDAFRGVAVLVMLVDHLVLVFGGPELVRDTVGRFAVPMFFLLAGHLASVPRVRTLGVAVLGCLLPLVVPWIDNPNVLLGWALGVFVLHTFRVNGFPVWLLAALALTLGANGWVQSHGHYDIGCLVGLMALGALLDRSAFTWAGVLPGWVAAVGRRPVSWYVGHLLVLQAVIVWASR